MTDRPSSPLALRAALLAGLARFRREGVAGTTPHAPGLFSYCALTRERLSSVRLPRPVVGIVLSGAKEVWRGETAERLSSGTLFVLPAEVDLDIVNEPAEGSGLYQSLVLEIAPEAVPDLDAGETEPAAGGSVAVALTAGLVEATVHAARAIEDGPAGATVRTARLAELLALLHDAPAARPLFDLSVAERVARLVRGGLDRDWTAAEVARRLALSESTLRRRLAAEGSTFSALLRRERMEAARRLMARGAASGAAALAVGYASRTHFARAFRAAFGGNPAQAAGRNAP
ncbi:MAG: AraC family transcriptional regulator [Phyllobacteriaceae bacterium]|nr:AraC family transcriptional regulator [Phyllobacteriaceae bacterium]